MLECQRNSQLRTLKTEVLGCTSREAGGFNVVLADTILYPEGGGQPADRGRINNIQVLDVQRNSEGRVLHHVNTRIDPGPVIIDVDWDRRFDHMQQHSGQHLLTAIVQRDLGLQTISFHMGARECHIELDGPVQSEDVRSRIEQEVNRVILAGISITYRVISSDDMDEETIRSRGLPTGHRGPIRIVEIEGIDSNTCGGTHVQHTGELGVLQLTRWERQKKSSRLYFLVGSRVRDALNSALQRSAEVTRLLDGGADSHASLIQKLLEREKNLQRTLKQTRTALAEAQAAALRHATGPLVYHHQLGGDLGQLRVLAQHAIQDADARIFILTSAHPDGSGVFLLAGQPDGVAQLGPVVAQMINGRGGGAGGRFQGKADSVQITKEQIAELLDLLKSQGLAVSTES